MRMILVAFLFSLCACDEEIVHLESELEANRVLLALADEEIPATKILDKKQWVVSVPDSHVNQALSVLDKASSRKHKKFMRDDPKLFESSIDRMERVNEKLAYKLEQSLVMFQGVIEAKVHIFETPRGRFSDSSDTSRSASVLIIVNEGTHIDMGSIKQLISKGAGVSLDLISIVSNEKKLRKRNYSAVARRKKEEGTVYYYYLPVLLLPGVILLMYVKKKKPKTLDKNIFTELEVS